MTHDIAGAGTGYEALILKDDPAWHRFGTVFRTPLSVGEGLKLAHLDWVVEKFPDYVEVTDANGIVIEKILTGKFSIVRPPTDWDKSRRVLGTVSRQYVPVQNGEIAELLEPLAGIWPLETAGALGKGERVFFSLKMGEYAVAGKDPLIEYALVSTGHDGGNSFNISVTSVRPVCRNTLVWGEEAASLQVKLAHRAGVLQTAADVLSIVAKIKMTNEKLHENLEILAATQADEAALKAISDAAYPLPKALQNLDRIVKKDLREALVYRYESEKELVQRQRLLTLEAYAKTNEATPAIAGTLWAAYNAVSMVEDHRPGHSSAQSAVFGTRAQTKVTALQTALAIARGA